MTPTTPLDAYLALAQRVRELEGMLGLGLTFLVGNTVTETVMVRCALSLCGTQRWIHSGSSEKFNTPEAAIRAAREYIKQQGGTLA